MIDLFTDCLRKFAKTYYMDVQNCGLMIIVAILIDLFTDYLRNILRAAELWINDHCCNWAKIAAQIYLTRLSAS